MEERITKKERRDRKAKRKNEQRAKYSRLWPIGILVLGAGLVMAFVFFYPRSEPWGLTAIPHNPRPATLPAELFTGKVAEVYRIAQEVPELLEQMPCYCGCYVSDRHRNNLDCYTDRHSVGWEICQDITLDAYAMYKKGRKFEDIKKAIDVKYSRFWPYGKKWPLWCRVSPQSRFGFETPVKFTAREISEKYNRFARWYDWVVGVPDLLGLRRLRRRLLRQASGKVLEVAVGTGKNLQYYTRGCRIIGIDVSREMLNVARKRTAKLSMNVSFSPMDAENLGFPVNSFDTVVSSLSTCTFPNPVIALQEMARVCRTDGKILLLEHGRSDREWLGRWQDRRADRHAKQFGCHWNRQPLELVQRAGLKIVESQRVFFGIFYEISLTPSKDRRAVGHPGG